MTMVHKTKWFLPLFSVAGRDGSPYAQLGAIAGVAYIGAVGFLRWRS